MPILPFNVTKIHQLRGELRINLQKFAHALVFRLKIKIKCIQIDIDEMTY